MKILARNYNPSRRTFLKASVAVGGGLMLELALPFDAFADATGSKTFSPNAWLRITPDNMVTVIVDKSEMGQGVYTSMPMLLAEELDADWAKLKMESAPAAKEYFHPWFGIQGTGGSTSVRAMWKPLREAGAAARSMLVSAAAQEWKVDAASLRTENSFVIAPDGKKLSYGQLADKAALMPVPKEPKLKDPKDFRIIGKATKRLDSPEKINGSAQFGIDAKLPGLLTAVVARSPVVGGKMVSFNADKAKAIKGVRAVMAVKNPTAEGVAVLADNFWAAKQGRDALEIKWDDGTNAKLNSADMLKTMTSLAQATTGEVKTAKKEGDVANANAAKTIEATYTVPYLAHAAMEPMNCTAWVKADSCELWVGSQTQTVDQMVAAQITGLPQEKVKVNTMLLGGGFGRRFAPDFVVEAVTLSKAANAPVKVVYTREDDTKSFYYRPAAVCHLRGGLDESGMPSMIYARTACDSVADGSGFEKALVNKEGIDTTAVEGLAEMPYAVAIKQTDWARYSPGVRTWFWRSVGNTQNIFFAESFIDEMATAAGKDPFEFRRMLMDKHPRHKAVLELAAQKAGWGTPLPAGRARGIAVAESFGSYVAEVAEVSIENGKPRVHRVVIAADVGMVVNPDTVIAQMEGAMVYGLTAAMYGEISFKDGKVEQNNFHDYQMLRMNEMPKVEVHIVKSGEAPGGGGEPGTPPIAPAVTNALFKLTGKRIRSLPIKL
ncbi:MAG: xanthine dehydrogenase family protein molybdopterin-binding subunit [Burkholderiales bacterium]